MALAKFEAFLAKYQNIQEKTKLVYKHDVEEFLNFTNGNSLKITEKHFENFINFLSFSGISYSYGIRKISALKIFDLFLSKNNNQKNIFDNLKIPVAKFPLFCTTERVEQILKSFDTSNDYTSLRNKVIFILTYKYEISIENLSTITFGHLPYYKLIEQDMYIINLYKQLLFLTMPFARGYAYLFPIQYGNQVKSISTKALWAILKKILQNNNRITTQNKIEFFLIDQEKQTIYKEKHPRG